MLDLFSFALNYENLHRRSFTLQTLSVCCARHVADMGDDYCLPFSLWVGNVHRHVTDYGTWYMSYISHIMELGEKQQAFCKTFKNVDVGHILGRVSV